MSGSQFLTRYNITEQSCSMLAWEFIYGLRDNNEQGPEGLELFC